MYEGKLEDKEYVYYCEKLNDLQLMPVDCDNGVWAAYYAKDVYSIVFYEKIGEL